MKNWLHLLSLSIAIIFLGLAISDPFGLAFWIPLYLSLILIGLAFIRIAYFLWRQAKFILKLSAIAPLAICLIFWVTAFGLATDYRWLLPDFKNNNPAVEDWKKDLTVLKKELLKHPAFADSLNESILSNTKITSDNADQNLVSLMMMAGKIPDGHTFIHPMQPCIKAAYFPLQGFWFDDGYYIIRAAGRYKALINKKIVSINHTPMEEVLVKTNALHGHENDWQAKSRFDMFAWSANVLHGLYIIPTHEECFVEYESNGTTKIIELRAEPVFTWLFWWLKPINDNQWDPAFANLRKPNYSIRHDQARSSVYITISMFKNSSTQTFDGLADQLDQILSVDKNSTVVIDLRNNMGGDNTLYNKLISVIHKYNEANKFYFLIGRKTFSAGVNFISEARQKGIITLVGEPTGAGANHYGDPRHVLLPNTKLSLFISTRKWQLDSLDNKNFYTPDVPVKFTIRDHVENIDPLMKFIQ